jgi:thymidylate synthase (FAD)
MVKLISSTPNAEKLLVYMARVSSPNQENPEKDKLINYLIRNKHWSPFEMIHMTVEIHTSRAIGRQILRHRSFTFQEFSQRYEKSVDFDFYGARRQDLKNRQNSVDDLPDEIDVWFLDAQEQVITLAHKLYYEALDKGIAKECARFLLPELAQTKMYMSGNLRSWIHYLELRTGQETQLEHREIAKECKRIFMEQFPTIAKALNWTCNEEQKTV